MTGRGREWCLMIALAGSTWATPMMAQAVRGTVTDADGATPAKGALIALQDVAQRTVARAIVHTDGQFEIAAPAAGHYTVVVERSGYASYIAPPIDIGASAPAPLKLTAASPRISFADVTAPAKSTCTLGPVLSDTPVLLWHAALTDLQRLNITESSRIVLRQIVVTERDYDANEKKVKTETNPRTYKVNQRSFLSTSPDSAAKFGFLKGDSTNFFFDVPDARVLASSEFFESHCFGIAPQDRVQDGARQIGLMFRPSVDKRGITDIEGTMWIDRATGTLASFEWSYAPTPSPRRTFGGEQTLGTTPGGYAYLSKWTHRYPEFALRSSGDGHLALSTDKQLRTTYVQSLVLGSVHEIITTATVLSDK